MDTQTLTIGNGPAIAAPVVPACGECGAALAPDGQCLEIGACGAADAAASRSSAAGATAKFAVPAAWNARGAVD